MKKTKEQIKHIVKYIVINLSLPIILFAQNINITDPTKVGGGLMDIIKALLEKVVMPIGAVLVVMYIIYAGFTFVTAQGKPKEIQEAQQRLLWALIGGGILLGAVAISQVVKNTASGLLNNTAG